MSTMGRSKMTDMRSLDDFNSTRGICQKCGHDKVTITYCRTMNSYCPVFKMIPKIEHLDRCCKRCGYRWVEKCMGGKSERIVRESKR